MDMHELADAVLDHAIWSFQRRGRTMITVIDGFLPLATNTKGFLVKTLSITPTESDSLYDELLSWFKDHREWVSERLQDYRNIKEDPTYISVYKDRYDALQKLYLLMRAESPSSNPEIQDVLEYLNKWTIP